MARLPHMAAPAAGTGDGVIDGCTSAPAGTAEAGCDARAIQAILFEPAEEGALAPLLERRSFGLLPIGADTLAGRTLAALAEAGVTRIAIAQGSDALRALVGDGARWGIELDPTLASPTDHRDRAAGLALGHGPGQWSAANDGLRRAGSIVIVLRLDALVCADDLRRLIAAAGHGDAQLHVLGVPLPACALSPASDAREEPVRVAAMRSTWLTEVADYWRANLRALRGHGHGHHVERRLDEATFVDPLASVHETAELSQPSLVCAHARVSARARIGPDTVVGRDALVGEDVDLRETIVLPGTMIGAQLSLHRKIVDGPCVLDVVSGEPLYIDDTRLLASIGRADAAARARVGPRERCAALLGLVAGLPLALLWAAGCMLRGQPVLEADTLEVQVARALDGRPLYQPVAVHCLACRNPRLRRLPWLVAVAAGRVPLRTVMRGPLAGGRIPVQG